MSGQVSTCARDQPFRLCTHRPGPNQSIENPIGEEGVRLHRWKFETASWREHQGLEGGEHSADSEVADEVVRDVGAYIMARIDRMLYQYYDLYQ